MGKRSGTHIRPTILVLLLLLGAFFVVATGTVSADQEGDYTFTVSDGKVTIIGYTGTGGAIIIPSTLGGYPVVAIGNSAFYSANGQLITSVIIPANITSIGNTSFQYCSLLAYVAIPNSVTFIGDNAFSSCTSLTSVVIPNNITTFGNYTFSNCTSLVSVIIPSNVTSIGDYAFYNCSALDSVTIGSGATSIGQYALSMCTSLTTVTIPSNVTSIGYSAFHECTNLTSMTFLGLVAPTTVGPDWILTTPVSLRGHAYAASNFPSPGQVWNELTMGGVIPIPPDVPTGLIAIPGNAQVSLNWTAPVQNGGSDITNYSVYRSTIETGTYSLIATPSDTDYNDTLLTNGQTYWYYVSAVNIAGEGTATAPISSMPFTVPNAPSGLTAIAGNAQVVLNWTAPVFNGGRNIDYYVIHQNGVALASHLTNLTDIITGLINGQSYSFTVAAHNLAGLSLQSNAVSETPITVPKSPTGLTAAPGNSKVILNWTTPSNNGGSTITSYNVYRGTTLGGEALLITLGDVLTYTDTSPNNGQTYYYGISAVNGAGEGDRSSSVIVIPGSTSIILSISCDASTAAIGFGVQITGNASHLLNGSGIVGLYLVLYYSVTSGATWNEITAVMTDSNGNYSTWWTPAATGDYLVRTDWAGNATLESSSAQVSLSVIQYSNNYVFSVESNSTVTALEFNSTSMELSFTVSGAAGTMGYVRIMISKELVTNPENVRLRFDGDQINYVINERTDSWILMFTYYHSSHQIVAELTALATPSAPIDFNAIPGNENMTLSWSAPTYSNASAVTGYLLSYGNAADALTNHIELDQLSYLLEGLTKGQTYYFKVAAKNDAGWGPNCSTIQSAAQGVPDAPRGLTAIAGHELVDLNWTVPSYTGPGAIYYHLFRDGTLIWNGTAQSYEDIEVANGVTYSYNVAANNTVGWGPNCTAVQATPTSDETAPSVPLGFEATAGNENVTLNWTEPSYLGPGTITYHLFRDGTEVWNGTAIAYLDTPLIKNVSYSYNVAAQNDIGWGLNSTVILATPFGVPDAPWGLNGMLGDMQSSLSWNVVNYSGPGALIYHLFRNDTLIWSGVEDTYQDVGLTNGQTYGYKVAASNSVGWSFNSSNVSVTPQGPPTAPRGLEAQAGNEIVDLNWTEPSYLGPGTITYHLFRDGSLIWNGTVLNYSDAAVSNGITYTYEVSANNSVGWGENSTSVQATPMSAEQTPTAPRNLTAIAGSENVTLTWEAPAYTNASAVVGYMISYGTSPDSLADQITWDQLVYILNNLTKGTTYYFTVAAQNSAGWGPNSTMASATPFGVPSVPLGFEAFAGDENVTLNWTAPSYLGPGTIIYHLFRDGSEVWSGTGLTYRDSSVTNGITYSYQLAASNDIGWGENCTALQATPQPVGSVPMAPRGLMAIAGSSLVDLNWTAPSYIGPGTITYHLFRDSILIWSGVVTSYKDVELTNGQTYEYKVSASNSVGWSSNSSSVSVTPQGSPSETIGLTASPGNGVINLNWTAPLYAGSGTLIYHLFRDGTLIWNGTATMHSDTGLINGQEYEYNVVASNSFGWGHLTTSVHATPIAPITDDNTLLYVGVGVIAIAAVLAAVLFVKRGSKGKRKA
jgi:fibronectin type 3 domain-containing protein